MTRENTKEKTGGLGRGRKEGQKSQVISQCEVTSGRDRTWGNRFQYGIVTSSIF